MRPLLFIVFYNDFVDQLANSRVLKYADDTVIYFPVKDKETIERALSQDLELIAEYFNQNELVINLKGILQPQNKCCLDEIS